MDQVAYVRFASVYREFKDIDQFMETIQSLARIRGNADDERSALVRDHAVLRHFHETVVDLSKVIRLRT